jgi:hypothetical protein
MAPRKAEDVTNNNLHVKQQQQLLFRPTIIWLEWENNNFSKNGLDKQYNRNLTRIQSTKYGELNTMTMISSLTENYKDH